FASLPGVTRCTSLICDTIAGLPWLVYRNDYDRVTTPDWIADPQGLRADGRIVGATPEDVRLSAVEFWTNWICSALGWGHGFVYAPLRDNTGAPRPPLWQLAPQDVAVRDQSYWVGDILLDPGSVIHLRGEPPYWDGRGRGVLVRHAFDLGLAL